MNVSLVNYILKTQQRRCCVNNTTMQDTRSNFCVVAYPGEGGVKNLYPKIVTCCTSNGQDSQCDNFATGWIYKGVVPC